MATFQLVFANLFSWANTSSRLRKIGTNVVVKFLSAACVLVQLVLIHIAATCIGWQSR